MTSFPFNITPSVALFAEIRKTSRGSHNFLGEEDLLTKQTFRVNKKIRVSAKGVHWNLPVWVLLIVEVGLFSRNITEPILCSIFA